MGSRDREAMKVGIPLLLLLAAAAPVARSAEPPPAPRTPSQPEPEADLPALLKKVDAESVIDSVGKRWILLASRPGPELSYGEPKHVALIVDRDGRVTGELDVAYSVGDAGVSVERGWEYLGAGLLRITVTNTSCTVEDPGDCERSVSSETHRVDARGTFEQLTPDGPYCDRATGEELELLVDPQDPQHPRVNYRSRKTPAPLALRVGSASPHLTRLEVAFPKRRVTYRLELREDYASLTSTGSDRSPKQTFVRGACER